MKKNWYTSKITLWILLGLLLGIGVGFIGMSNAEAFAKVQPALDLFYSLYISALRMMIFPLVFCSIVMGIQSIGSVGKTGKVSVVKNAPGENEIQALTSATITSTAVVNAVNDAVDQFNEITGGGK